MSYFIAPKNAFLCLTMRTSIVSASIDSSHDLTPEILKLAASFVTELCTHLTVSRFLYRDEHNLKHPLLLLLFQHFVEQTRRLAGGCGWQRAAVAVAKRAQLCWRRCKENISVCGRRDTRERQRVRAEKWLDSESKEIINESN